MENNKKKRKGGLRIKEWIRESVMCGKGIITSRCQR